LRPTIDLGIRRLSGIQPRGMQWTITVAAVRVDRSWRREPSRRGIVTLLEYQDTGRDNQRSRASGYELCRVELAVRAGPAH